MNNHQSDLSSHLQELLHHLQETEDKAGGLLTRLDTCIRLCADSLRQFRQSVTDHGFPDRATEIYFFKHIKPGVLGRYTYYRRLHQLHLGEMKGCRKHEKERLTRELEAISLAFERNNALWQYYRSGSRTFDEQYFLRGNVDWKIHPVSTHFDDLFSTCWDAQLTERKQPARFLNRMLQQYNRYLDSKGD